MSVNVKTAPSVEPVTLAEARSHLRLVASGSPASHPDDDFVESAIQAAREHAENFMRRTIIETEFEWKFDKFPGTSKDALILPRNSVISVSSIGYTDSDGNSQTFSDYTLSTSGFYSFIVPDYDLPWPTARGHTEDVTITFKAGYAPDSSPADYRANVPASIKSAIKLFVGHLYENRETVALGTIATNLPMAFESLLWPHRILSM